MKRIATVLGLLLPLIATPASACGADTDCTLGERTYRIAMPDNTDKPVGAILFMHGFRGSAAGTMRNKSLRNAANDLGVALIAAKSLEADWALAGSPSGKKPKEMGYFDALLEDVTINHGIDPNKIMATGFSAGGMMTWTLACQRGDRFMGFAPMAGTFWETIPESCETPPVNLVHIHGTSDEVVPLTGRPIRQTKQGNVFEVFDMYAEHGKYTDPVEATKNNLTCKRQTNQNGKFLELCLHDGGHSFRTEYLIHAWNSLQQNQ